MRGADTVVREIIRGAVATVFDQHFPSVNTQQIEQWFNLGGSVQLNDEQPSATSLTELKQIQGLFEKLAPFHITAKSKPELAVSAAEFLLEGMTAHKRISRSEERAFTAAEKKQRNQDAASYAERIRDREFEDPKTRSRRGFN
jgi:magnesium chelatase subunit I